MSKHSRYKLIIFDWDGTIVDSEAFIVHCIQAAAKDEGLVSPSAEAIKNTIGLSFELAVRTLFPDAGKKKFQSFTQTYRSYYFSQEHKPVTFPGVVSCLDTLKTQGYWLAVATGKGRKGLKKDLAALNLNDYFIATRTASQTLSKPNPQMLHEILDELGLESTQALMVGDTTYDLEMANNANMDALGVTYGVCSEASLLKLSPLALIDKIDGLLDWLNTSS